MLSNVNDIKKHMKEYNSVNEQKINSIKIIIEEFGEGFNTYVDVYYDNNNGISFTIGEEEKLYNAKKRANRTCESLSKLCVDVKIVGFDLTDV